MTSEPRPHSAEYFGDQRDFWWNRDFVELMARRWQLSQARSVLEVGSGVGHWSRVLAPSLAPEAKLVGVEREPKWVAEATARAQAHGLGVNVEKLAPVHRVKRSRRDGQPVGYHGEGLRSESDAGRRLLVRSSVSVPAAAGTGLLRRPRWRGGLRQPEGRRRPDVRRMMRPSTSAVGGAAVRADRSTRRQREHRDATDEEPMGLRKCRHFTSRRDGECAPVTFSSAKASGRSSPCRHRVA